MRYNCEKAFSGLQLQHIYCSFLFCK